MEQKLVKTMERENALQMALSKDFQLNLSDFALFMSVMKVKEAYESVLSIILDETDFSLICPASMEDRNWSVYCST